MKKSTIIFGGSFNPPTIAHQAILKACIDYLSESGGEIWIIPSGSRTDKTITTPRELRIKYIRAMVDDIRPINKNVKVKTILTEIDRKIMVETYDTAIELASKYPDRKFIWVYGDDSIETILEWKNGLWLAENLNMLIVKRRNNGVNKAVKHLSILDIDIPSGVSSTELKRRIADKEPIDNLVSKSVKNIIENQ